MHIEKRFCTVAGLLAGALITMTSGCKGQDEPADQPPQPVAQAGDADVPDEPAAAAPRADKLEPPVGLEVFPTPSPEDNPTTADKAALGEMLFFDKRLSDSGTFACVACHMPEKGWTDGKKLSVKADGGTNTRHSPTMYNVGYALQWYWDGRMPTLEAQILQWRARP